MLLFPSVIFIAVAVVVKAAATAAVRSGRKHLKNVFLDRCPHDMLKCDRHFELILASHILLLPQKVISLQHLSRRLFFRVLDGQLGFPNKRLKRI